MPEKQITMNQLAEMIKKGFDNTVTKQQFENLERDVSVLKKDVNYIKENLEDSGKLAQRVDYIENTLNIQPIEK